MTKSYILINEDGQTVGAASTRRKALAKAMRDMKRGALHRGVVEVRALQTHNLKPIGARRSLHGLAGRFGTLRELPLPRVTPHLVRAYGSIPKIFRDEVSA